MDKRVQKSVCQSVKKSVVEHVGNYLTSSVNASFTESVGEGAGEGMRAGAGEEVENGIDTAMGEGVGEVDADMGEGVEEADARLFDDSDDDDRSYLPSCGEDETDDDMDAEELVSDDEEYTRGRRKVKEKKIFVITDDMLLGIDDGGLKSDYISAYENSEEIIYTLTQQILKMKVDEGGTDMLRANKKQFEAACQKPCVWFCSGSLSKKKCVVVIKRLEGVHTCPRPMRNKIVASSWIARKYLQVVRLSPTLTCKDLGRDLMERYGFDATKWLLYHAKRKAIDMLVGTVEDHYAKVRSYTLELGRSDIEGRFELHVNVGVVFKAMYIGFSGLRKGFKEGCRRVIGLDGAFLKTYLGGILLSAVGTDGYNQMYPIACAMVEVENEVCWSWFVNILTQELNL